MTKYRDTLPLLSRDPFLTDGGLETTLIFHDGLELPCFAAFDLLRTDRGRAALRSYFRTYADIARNHGVGLVLESPTWRASQGWGRLLGYSAETLAEANRAAIVLLEEIRDECETEDSPMVISGCIGPRGDGYDPGHPITAGEARRYHATQIGILAATAVDMVSALTVNQPPEAIGIVRAAVAARLPVAVSFTVETDGRLPTGESLASAIETVDEATDGAPVYYMINCAHPTHFEHELQAGGSWTDRIRGIRANASPKSHAELDEAEELDAGDPEELAAQYRELRRRFGQLSILGGCCGTDHRHIEAIARECAGPDRSPLPTSRPDHQGAPAHGA